MSEGSEDAAILIATSYQALHRVLEEKPDTLITDCTVLILFAGFYVEATLNYIIECTDKKNKLDSFPQRNNDPHRRNNPGMRDKLAWFYNEFVEVSPASNWRDINLGDIDAKLREKFPGFLELHSFRNDISHGRVNQSARSIATAKRLRQQAKDLVGQLYAITAEKGYTVPRLITYKQALASISKQPPT